MKPFNVPTDVLPVILGTPKSNETYENFTQERERDTLDTDILDTYILDTGTKPAFTQSPKIALAISHSYIKISTLQDSDYVLSTRIDDVIKSVLDDFKDGILSFYIDDPQFTYKFSDVCYSRMRVEIDNFNRYLYNLKKQNEMNHAFKVATQNKREQASTLLKTVLDAYTLDYHLNNLTLDVNLETLPTGANLICLETMVIQFNRLSFKQLVKSDSSIHTSSVLIPFVNGHLSTRPKFYQIIVLDMSEDTYNFHIVIEGSCSKALIYTRNHHLGEYQLKDLGYDWQPYFNV